MRPDPHTIFVTGSGRSGTNILKQLLTLHPTVSSLHFEQRFTIDPDGLVDFYRSFPASWSPYRSDKQLKRFEAFLLSLAKRDDTGSDKDQPYEAWELDRWIPGYSTLVGELMEQLAQLSHEGRWPGANSEDSVMYYSGPVQKSSLAPALSEFLLKCYDALRASLKCEVLVEDNTHSLLFAEDLLHLCPGSKMIHVMRNPLDVISSLKHQRWAPSDVAQLCTWYHDMLNRWFEERSKLDTSRLLEVRFEDLVFEKESSIQGICEFIGLEKVEKMIQFDLSKHNIGRYRSDLSALEQEMVRERLQPIMDAYQYDVNR